MSLRSVVCILQSGNLVFSSKFFRFAGNAQNFPFPLEDKYELDPKTGYPSSEDCAKHLWGDYYFTEASAAAFQNLYNNTDGLLDAWAEFWGRTAQGFKDQRNIIGYELINEPFAGDIFR